MNVIVTYTSKTGFTKQYAQWIAEELACESVELKQAKNLGEYDLVIHGGWLMAGFINGAKELLKKRKEKIVFFGVGSTQNPSEQYLSQIKEQNKISDFQFYFMKGGFKKDKMSWLDKKIIKMVAKGEVQDVDWSGKDQIKQLVEHVKSL